MIITYDFETPERLIQLHVNITAIILIFCSRLTF